MALETATYISDLVAANPTSSDPKSQGDDHLRLLKATIKTTFPNVNGSVNATPAQFNYLVGVTSLIQPQLNTLTAEKGSISGQTWTGNHTFPATTYGVTAALGDSSTKFATTEFVAGTAFSIVFPAQTGNNGKFITTNGTTASWANHAEVPLGSLVAFDSSKSENLITSGNASYLKTGVIADASSYPLADSSAWMTGTLETLPTGLSAGASIATGNGVWITVAQGFASVSTDGVGFGTSISLTGFSAGSHSISFGNGIFVILDSSNAVCATTTNGASFSYGTLPTAGSWCIPVYGGGTWLSVRTGTFAITSTDGLSWTARTNSLSVVISQGHQFQPIAYGAGLFVVISQKDGTGNYSTTADGITWVSRTQTSGGVGMVNVIFANSLFVVRASRVTSSGVIRTSTDGITFTSRTVALSVTASESPVYYHNSNYVLQDGDIVTLFTSTDAITWAALASTSLDATDIFYQVIVSGTQALALNSVGKLYRSDGAGYWGAINVCLVPGAITQLNYSNSRFMYNDVGGNYSAGMSIDGTNFWKLHSQGVLGGVSINYNAGLYIVAGSTTGFHTSPDLSTWTSRTGLHALSNTLVVANVITFAITPNSGNHTAYKYSTDNITFTSGTLPTSATWNDVIFGNSLYLAVSTTTAAASSATGLVGSWTARTLPIIPVGCVFASGFFVIANSAGVFYKSSDLVTWTLIPTSTFNLDSTGTLVVGLFKMGTSVFGYRGTLSKTLVWSGGDTVTTRTIPFNATYRANVASSGALAIGLRNATTNYKGVVATDKVINDVNLKTYHATPDEQTNFYKRVA